MADDWANVLVPKRHIIKIYRFVADLESEEPKIKAQKGKEPFYGLLEPSGEWANPEFCQLIWQGCGQKMQAVLSFLANHPEEWVSIEQLAKELGLGTKSVGSYLGHFTKYCEKHSGKKTWPFIYREAPQTQGAEYYMPQAQANLFRQF